MKILKALGLLALVVLASAGSLGIAIYEAYRKLDDDPVYYSYE